MRTTGVQGDGNRMSPIAYRGFWIEYDPPPIPVRTCDWRWWHDSYDGAPDSGDRRCGASPSLEAAQQDIDEMLAELEDAASGNVSP